MKRSLVLTAFLLIVVLAAASPVQAFTAKSMDIMVQQNTDAVITFRYELSWLENVAVFMRITDPGAELKNALETNYNKPVTVLGVNQGEVQVLVPSFAITQDLNGTVIMTTSSLSFQNAQKVLDQYWFAPLINANFSPAVSRVTFPDGYSEEFYNQISIPSIQHVLSS
jgi:hypothetical protein